MFNQITECWTEARLYYPEFIWAAMIHLSAKKKNKLCCTLNKTIVFISKFTKIWLFDLRYQYSIYVFDRINTGCNNEFIIDQKRQQFRLCTLRSVKYLHFYQKHDTNITNKKKICISFEMCWNMFLTKNGNCSQHVCTCIIQHWN